jgi:hypothetical protein
MRRSAWTKFMKSDMPLSVELGARLAAQRVFISCGERVARPDARITRLPTAEGQSPHARRARMVPKNKS